MDTNFQPLVDAYDRSQKAGKTVISESWKSLRPETRSWLIQSGYYSECGRAAPELPDDSADVVESLEYHLGTLALCSKALLPRRAEKNAPISLDAFNDNVPTSVSEILFHPYGLEPYFLRVALHAIRNHEMANLMERLPALAEFSTAKNLGKLAFIGFCILLLLLSPLVVAGALSSAFAGKFGDTAAALYGIGFIAWMLNIAKGLGEEAPDNTQAGKDAQAYEAWRQLGPYGLGDWSLLGAGATAYFEEMQRKGLSVPIIAFDVAAALKATTLNAYQINGKF
jgi:hypothetical protein